LATRQSTQNNIHAGICRTEIRYIHNNRVDAGIVEKEEEYIIAVPGIIFMASNAGFTSP